MRTSFTLVPVCTSWEGTRFRLAVVPLQTTLNVSSKHFKAWIFRAKFWDKYLAGSLALIQLRASLWLDSATFHLLLLSLEVHTLQSPPYTQRLPWGTPRTQSFMLSDTHSSFPFSGQSGQDRDPCPETSWKPQRFWPAKWELAPTP